MFRTTFNRFFNLFILFALLTSALAMTSATASRKAESEQVAKLSVMAQATNEVTARVLMDSDESQGNSELFNLSISYQNVLIPKWQIQTADSGWSPIVSGVAIDLQNHYHMVFKGKHL